MTYETVHRTTKHGFDIALAILPECEQLDWEFESEQERQKLLDEINNGNLLYFIAKVTASKHGIELGVDYLGGCVYSNIQEFLKDGYFPDMVNNAILDAKVNITNLCKEQS